MPRPRKSKLHLPPRVYQKHGAYYFVDRNNKWLRLAKVGEEQLMRVRWAAIDSPIEEAGTVSALLDEYLSKYASIHKAPRTFKDNVKEAIYLKTYFGHMLPQHIEPRHIGMYLDANLESRPVRANREKALLSHVFSWAMRQPSWGIHVKSNPCKGVARNKETKRIRIVSDEDFMGIYQYAHPNLKRLMTLIYRTLQRPSDILILTSQNIINQDINGEMVDLLQVGQGKTGHNVKIILTPEIKSALYNNQDFNFNKTQYLIVNRFNNPYTLEGMNTLFSRAKKQYCEAYARIHGKNPQQFGLYDIKGKGATDMFQNGVPLEEIQALAGHESVKTTEIYIKQKLNKPVTSNIRKIISNNVGD